MSDVDQSGCSCCEGIEVQTPAEIYNPPGLPAIAYRVGTYAQFKQSMQARLADMDLPGLGPFKTRADDDFSIALLDSWAMAADVLTFYSERIANESYKRTATERTSLLELAHLVNYELQSGVAANTYLAFTLEDAIGSPESTTIPIGTKVQSLPNPGEKPQVFEATEEIEAHAAWNALKPGLTKDQVLLPDMPRVILKGTSTNLRSGDALLIIVEDANEKTGFAKAFRFIKGVAIDSVRQQTIVEFEAVASLASGKEQGASTTTPGMQGSPAVPGDGQGQPPAVPGSGDGKGQPPATPAKEGFFGTIGQDIDQLGHVIGQDIDKLSKGIHEEIDELLQKTPAATGQGVPALTAMAAQGQGVAGDGQKQVTIQQAAGSTSLTPIDHPLVAFKQLQPLTTSSAAELVSVPGVSQSKLEDVAVVQGWSIQDMFANIAAQPPQPPGSTELAIQPTQPLGLGSTVEPGIYALRARASLFGYNAPDWKAMHDSIRGHYPNSSGSDWTLDPQQNQPDQLDLDRVYPQIIPRGWLIIEQPGKDPLVVQATSVTETAASNYALSAKITRVSIDPPIPPVTTFSEHRQVTVYCVSEALQPAQIPNTDVVQGSSVDIPGLTSGPESGRTVMIVGQSDGSNGLPKAEIVILGDSNVGSTGTTLNFKQKLANVYKRDTLSIYGNIATATQGETIQDEVLGSGDASQSYQRFTLRQSPLTYIQASTPDGKASTLSISVDGIPWKEVDTFYGHGPLERIYVTHIEDDGTVTVEFGDGLTSARLPTGEDNVHATYRKGTGLQGVVQPGQIRVLQTRPLGVKSVTNPLAPTGADDPETIDDARRNASNTIFTLGRIVSGEDYETFALSFARVAKAQATTIWTNRVRGVYVTIAGPPTSETLDSTKISADSPLYEKIYSRIRNASDPTVPFVLQSFSLVLFRLAVKVKVNPDNPGDQVLKAVEQAVRTHFSFDNRDFGQGVALNEVITVIQAAPGVVTARIDRFYDVLKPPSRETYIDAALPHIRQDGTVSLAELLLVSPNQPFDSLEVMA